VKRGEVLARVHASSRANASAACARLKGAFEISARPAPATPLVSEIVAC